MLLLYRGEDFDPNSYFHAKVDIDHSFFLEDGSRRILFVPKMNERQAKLSFKGRVLTYTDPIKDLKPFIGRRSVSYDASAMSARLAGRLGKICRLKDASEVLASERMRKRPDEIALIRRAVRETKDILDSLEIKTGSTELDLKKRILMEILDRGLEPSFEPIVASGSNSAIPHHRPGKKKLSSMVLVDMGVRHRHYCSDLTRCFILDGDPLLKEEHERLQGVFHSILDRLPESRTGSGASSLATEEITKAGFPKLIHSIGHGIGLEVHERPSLRKGSKDLLEGATLAIEPAFYKTGYGMRYEETIHLAGGRARVL